MGRYEHKQVRARGPDGKSVWVDEGMKAFLEALWAHHLPTVMSCQESNPAPEWPEELPQYCWVAFEGAAAATRFLYLAWQVAGAGMRDRMEDEWAVPGSWHYGAFPVHVEAGVFALCVSLRLPIDDKDRLAGLLGQPVGQKVAPASGRQGENRGGSPTGVSPAH
jgi:hypothetical protein